MDIGPGAGSRRRGGCLRYGGGADEYTGIHHGTVPERALSIPVPEKRRKPAGWIKVKGAAENNLRNIDVKFPWES